MAVCDFIRELARACVCYGVRECPSMEIKVKYATDWPVGCALQLDLKLAACFGSSILYVVVCRPGGRGMLGSTRSRKGRIHQRGSLGSEGVLKSVRKQIITKLLRMKLRCKLLLACARIEFKARPSPHLLCTYYSDDAPSNF